MNEDADGTIKKKTVDKIIVLQYITSQNPPLTWDWSIDFMKAGYSDSKPDINFSAFSNASSLASSEAYTLLA